MAQNNQHPATIYLWGNLCGDPEGHSSEAKSITRMVYDEVLDEVVEREFQLPERNFLTYSIATGGYGDKPVRFHRCVDWEGVGFRLRKGDRVKLTGYFEERTYTTKEGETKSSRQFVVVAAEIKRIKIRHEAA